MKVTRRQFLLAGAAPALAQQRTPARAETRPNILLILADDLSAWVLGCYGNKEFKTPNIDELARGGVRFLFHNACTPIGSASRATMFTGRTPRQHGIHDYLTDRPIEKPPQGQGAPPPAFAKEIMISDLLDGAGYRCGYIGRWHMGDDRAPQHRYTFWYTLASASSRYLNPTMSWNGKLVDETGYMAGLITAKAGQFLDDQRPEQPFFLVASYLNPHTPYEGHPQKYYDLYANVPFNTTGWEPASPRALREKEMLEDTVANLRKYGAAVTALDDQVGLLIGKLNQRGRRESTIVIFASDNGYLLGRHGLWSAGLASNPINMYEEVVLTPMIWNWPGRTPVQGRRPEMVGTYDFLPTVCEAAGVEPPGDRGLCGRSYLNLATGKPVPRNRPWPATVFGHFRDTEMARDNRYKLVLRNEGAGPNELYDLRGDPRERANQYENQHYVTVRDRLRRELEGWRSRTSKGG